MKTKAKFTLFLLSPEQGRGRDRPVVGFSGKANCVVRGLWGHTEDQPNPPCACSSPGKTMCPVKPNRERYETFSDLHFSERSFGSLQDFGEGVVNADRQQNLFPGTKKPRPSTPNPLSRGPSFNQSRTQLRSDPGRKKREPFLGKTIFQWGSHPPPPPKKKREKGEPRNN